ncbi:hypothetical protein V8B97DRAFT_2009689 [Scleroderma yunnanense]
MPSFRQELPPERPTGARAPPTRLLSLDLGDGNKRNPTDLGVSSAYGPQGLNNDQEFQSFNQGRSRTSSAPAHHTNQDPFTKQVRWTDEPLVESPHPGSAEDFGSLVSAGIPTPPVAKRSFSPRFALAVRKSSIPSSGDQPLDHTDLASTRTPSKVRWDQLRQHVVHSTTALPASPTPSSQTLNPGSPIPSTPKTSRLARLGLRQVVDYVRDAAVDDCRMLADDILKVCWSPRLSDARVGPEREASTSSVGPSSYLPFVSNASLNSASIGTSTTLVHPSRDSQRPVSTSFTGQSVSQVLALHEIIVRYASRNASFLPHEPLVHATLLKPFLLNQTKQWTEGEIYTAVETFETTVKIWRPASAEMGVERIIWCCSAARSPTPVRSRIIGILHSLLFPRTGPVEFRDPGAFVSLVQSLLVTLVSIVEEGSGLPEAATLRDLIAQLRSGKCGSLASYLADAEVDGVSVMLDGVDDAELRDALISEAAVQCCKHSPSWIKDRIMTHYLEDYWKPSLQSTPYGPLIAVTHMRRLLAFSNVVISLVSTSSEPSMARIVYFLESRVNKEIALISEKRSAEPIKWIVTSLLEALCTGNLLREDGERILALLTSYLANAQYKSSVEHSIQKMISDRDWSTTCCIVEALFTLPENVRSSIFSIVLPLLHERIAFNPPSEDNSMLRGILEKASRLYPQVFFKPLFACAASTKDLSVAHHLQQLVGISALLPDFWLHDPDMVVVALMNEVGDSQQGTHRPYGKARLGQTALMVELIMVVKSLTAINPAPHSGDLTASAVQFFNALETRLGVILEAREKTTLIPEPQRLLLSVFLREIRLLSRSIKRSQWLSVSISWLLHSQSGASIDDGAGSVPVSANPTEVQEVISQLEALYRSTQEALHLSQKRKSTMLPASFLVSTSNKIKEHQSKLDVLFTDRAHFLTSLSKSACQEITKLLVVISSSLTTEDYGLLGPFLWKHCLNDASSPVAMSAAFLIMQSAEKAPMALLDAIKGDLNSDKDHVKITAIHRIDILVALRFQILSQDFLLDRNRRRPFRSARDPLPFVATSVGSSLFVQEEDQKEEEGGMPFELRKRLAEVGWLDEKDHGDRKRDRARTPISLLPVYVVDRAISEEGGILSSISPSDSRSARPNNDVSDLGLSAKTSDSTARFGKRRAIFVPALTVLFPRLISMACDSCLEVASTARDCILHVLRSDPALILRCVFDLVAGSKIDDAMAAIQGLLHLRHVLPPAATYYIFNHSMGYLKWIARESDANDPLHDFSVSSTVLSDLLPQVSEMSLREIRRAKVESFLIPTGSLWFTETAPGGSMFPLAIVPEESNATHLSMLIAITMIRLSQNRLLLALLKKHPQEVHTIRKGMKRLELPSLDNARVENVLTLESLLPSRHRSSTTMSSSHQRIDILSSLLSRSYLLLVIQIFKSMSRIVGDRNEIATFIDGINRILLSHGSDIGIVTQGLIALMVASTRFRRLFTSGGGYPLFILVVLKVYAEQEGNQRIEQAIEYAVNRFYALHQEAFLFQTLDVVGHAVMTKGCEDSWTMAHVHRLLSSLRYDNPTISLDSLGIRDSTRLQEKEALMVTTAEERPQTFMESIRRDGVNEKRLVIDLPEEYASVSLLPENMVRLLLTVIAHDPSIQRAQYFLRLLRLSVRTMYDVSKPARNVLRDGIDAIGAIVLRAHPKSRNSESAPLLMNDYSDVNVSYEEVILVNSLQEKSKRPSDIITMQLDFLHLVIEYLRCGGQVLATTSRKFFEITRVLMREATGQQAEIAEVLCQYSVVFLNPTNQQSGRDVTAFLEIVAPIIHAHGATADFNGIYEAIIPVVSDNKFTNDPHFLHTLVTHVCRAGLHAQVTRCVRREVPLQSATSPLVRLVAVITSISGTDAVAEVERRPPSYQFINGILLPLVLTLDSSVHLDRHGHQHIDAGVWLRLLSYVLNVCQNNIRVPTPSSPPEHPKSGDKPHSSTHREEIVMTIVAALQVLKVICVKAVEAISRLPGIWSRLTTVLKSILAEGDASFAFGVAEFSAPSSPVHSPRHSISSFDPFSGPDTLRPSETFDFSHTLHPPSSPRLIDYLLWSVLELVCLSRSPLMLQLRHLIQDKVRRLNDEIRAHQGGFYPRTQARRVSSVFSKPRRRLSTSSSSPQASVLPHGLSPSSGSSRMLDVDVNVGRRAGFERSPTSSPGRPSHLPRIIHLGPAQLSDSRRSASPTGTTRMFLKSSTVKSSQLVHATYRRIRLVQASMGYDLLLPLPAGIETDEEFDAIKAWTKSQAIDALVREMGDLAEEFSQTSEDLEGDDSMVIVDPNESTTF